MIFEEKKTGEARTDVLRDRKAEDELDPVLDKVLGNFRQCVHAWSESAYQHTRNETRAAVPGGWRLAVGWAMGCVLVAGGVSGGMYEHHRQVLAKIRAEQEAKQQQLAAQERARATDEDLLAAVDSEVSQEVPAAMEPLAQLMEGDESQ